MNDAARAARCASAAGPARAISASRPERCSRLLHKLREAMAEEMKGRKIGGDGIVAEIDGGYFGGYVKPANHVENRRDRRLFASLCARGVMARRPSPDQQWRSGSHGFRSGDEARTVCGFLRVLAAQKVSVTLWITLLKSWG